MVGLPATAASGGARPVDSGTLSGGRSPYLKPRAPLILELAGSEIEIKAHGARNPHLTER